MVDYNVKTNATTIYGDLANTKVQAINEIGALKETPKGTIGFNKFFNTEMERQVQSLKSILAL